MSRTRHPVSAGELVGPSPSFFAQAVTTLYDRRHASVSSRLSIRYIRPGGQLDSWRAHRPVHRTVRRLHLRGTGRRRCGFTPGQEREQSPSCGNLLSKRRLTSLCQRRLPGGILDQRVVWSLADPTFPVRVKEQPQRAARRFMAQQTDHQRSGLAAAWTVTREVSEFSQERPLLATVSVTSNGNSCSCLVRTKSRCSHAPTLIFPQYVNGQAGMNNATRVVLRNSEPQARPA